jgi:hypothetical protein
VPSFEFAAELFSALGDPGRLKILEYMIKPKTLVLYILINNGI